jgi:hypothetical protein
MKALQVRRAFIALPYSCSPEEAASLLISTFARVGRLAWGLTQLVMHRYPDA